ncbi:MAG: FAD/NAD(P)-binding protein [Candidatus Firestonebacteria bacterium]
MKEKDIYKPHLMTVDYIKQETPDVKTFRFIFQDTEAGQKFSFSAGQFLILSVFGVGEAVFTFANSPTRKGYIECSIKKVGKVSEAIHDIEIGDTVGLRGPYGNCFPVDKLKGKKLLFIGGGIGLAALKSLLEYSIDMKQDFKSRFLLYGARSPQDLCYKESLPVWQKEGEMDVFLTVDKGDNEWKQKVGLIPTVLKELNPTPLDTIAITCGPPVMIKFTVVALKDLGFSDDDIVTTLELKMKCGLGKCGRCNIGSIYVCKDGPVFTYKQMLALPDEY